MGKSYALHEIAGKHILRFSHQQKVSVAGREGKVAQAVTGPIGVRADLTVPLLITPSGEMCPRSLPPTQSLLSFKTYCISAPPSPSNEPHLLT